MAPKLTYRSFYTYPGGEALAEPDAWDYLSDFESVLSLIDFAPREKIDPRGAFSPTTHPYLPAKSRPLAPALDTSAPLLLRFRHHLQAPFINPFRAFSPSLPQPFASNSRALSGLPNPRA